MLRCGDFLDKSFIGRFHHVTRWETLLGGIGCGVRKIMISRFQQRKNIKVEKSRFVLDTRNRNGYNQRKSIPGAVPR